MGSGLVQFAYYKFRFGYLKIGYCDDVVFSLYRVDEMGTDHVQTTFSDGVYKDVEAYLFGYIKEMTFPYELMGTPFQKKVWEALCCIPYGETRTYKEIAIQIGNPLASRAVGMANNRNPIFLKVPCHRVIGANGNLTGYAGGLEMKSFLLEMESKNK